MGSPIVGVSLPLSASDEATDWLLQTLRDSDAARCASEARYRELVDQVSDVIFSLSPQGHIQTINRAGLELTGYDEGALLGRDVATLLTPTNPPPDSSGFRWPPNSGWGAHNVDIAGRDRRVITLRVVLTPVYEHGVLVAIHGIGRDMTDRLRARSAWRAINARLEDTARRIAHALHDEAGQLLASLYLKVAELERRPGRHRAAGLHELRDLLDQVDRDIRRLAHELRPTILDDLGLIRALQSIGDGMAARHGVRIDVTGSTEGRLRAEVELAAYRVVQEALTNACRHGHPARIHIAAVCGPHGLVLTVRDDGTGFDSATVLKGRGRRGLGLMGMRERLAAVGGAVTIVSTPGRGTLITLNVPLEDR